MTEIEVSRKLIDALESALAAAKGQIGILKSMNENKDKIISNLQKMLEIARS